MIAKRRISEDSEMTEPIYVHFLSDNQKIDKDFIGRIVRFMDEWSTTKTDNNCN